MKKVTLLLLFFLFMFTSTGCDVGFIGDNSEMAKLSDALKGVSLYDGIIKVGEMSLTELADDDFSKGNTKFNKIKLYIEDEYLERNLEYLFFQILVEDSERLKIQVYSEPYFILPEDEEGSTEEGENGGLELPQYDTSNYNTEFSYTSTKDYLDFMIFEVNHKFDKSYGLLHCYVIEFSVEGDEDNQLPLPSIHIDSLEMWYTKK